jgi:hypothetical protein
LKTFRFRGFTFVVKTFAKEFTTGHVQTLFRSIFYAQDAPRHPALVAPIGCAFIDVDRTYRPSFAYPHIPGNGLPNSLVVIH